MFFGARSQENTRNSWNSLIDSGKQLHNLYTWYICCSGRPTVFILGTLIEIIIPHKTIAHLRWTVLILGHSGSFWGHLGSFWGHNKVCSISMISVQIFLFYFFVRHHDASSYQLSILRPIWKEPIHFKLSRRRLFNVCGNFGPIGAKKINEIHQSIQT